MKIDCISDLHGFHPQLEGGDLLIVAGDLTAGDQIEEYLEFNKWLIEQEYKRKIVIAGNHDGCLQLDYNFGSKPFLEIAEYLCDSGTEFEGLKIWGSPWTLTFPGMNPHCKAFTVDSEEQLIDKWKLIPYDVDILVTHMPAYRILDKMNRGEHVGSISLTNHLRYVFRPYLHVFGHVHEGYGIIETFACRENKMMKSVNASIMNEVYAPVNKPVRIEL